MEDKRTLLAFLVIGVILLAMPYYYELVGVAPAPQPEVEQDATPPTSEAPSAARANRPTPYRPPAALEADTDAGAARVESDMLFGAGPSQFIPRLIEVTTPLQHLVFSTEGGVLTSATLVGYNRHDGEAVQLMPQDGKGLAISITQADARTVIDLSGHEFVPDKESLHLDPDDTAWLEFRAVLPGGEVVIKRMQFAGNRYGIDLELAVAGFDEDAIATVNWTGGITDAERDWQVDLEALRAMAYLNESLEELSAEEDPVRWTERGALKWAGVRNKYFMCSLAPSRAGRYHVTLSAKEVPVTDQGRFHREQDAPVTWPECDFSVGARLAESGWSALLYIGPLDYEEITSYGVEMERAIDLGFPVVRDISQLLLVPPPPADAHFYRSLPDFQQHDRTAPGAVLAMDRRPVATGPVVRRRY